MRRLAWALIGCAVLTTCGTAEPEALTPSARGPATPPATVVGPTEAPDGEEPTDLSVCAPPNEALVDAVDVEVLGTYDADQRALIDWALDRFDQAGLRLPATIRIGFDPTRVSCDGQEGLCSPDAHPPRLVVCQRSGEFELQRMNQRMTLLHELAHVWHRTLGDGTTWPDEAPIVGGLPDAPDVPWSERTVERVAIVVTWGLMDQYRRPVPTDEPCAELYRQFVALTGREPLGPLEVVCLPDPP